MDNEKENEFSNAMAGERLRKLRKHFKLTQREIAEKVGVTQGIWARYELGTAGLSKRVLMLLENTFEANPEYLTGESDVMFKLAKKDNRQDMIYRAMGLYYALSPKKKEIVDNYLNATLDLIANLSEQP